MTSVVLVDLHVKNVHSCDIIRTHQSVYMDINNTINDVISYAEANPLIAAAIAIFLLYMLIRKPKILLGLIVIALLWSAVMKIIEKLFEVSTL